MTIDPDTPILNLKAVVQETGLTPDTLRAWERRYGLPRPGRSTGRQRLYSRRDVEILKWLTTRLHEGLSISRAVEEWHRREAGETTGPDAQSVPLSEVASLDDLRARWVQAGLNFDRTGAERVLTEAFALYPLSHVCHEILLRGLAEVGERWYHNLATVHQEHFTTELATRQVEQLLAAAPPPAHPQRIIVGCPAGEYHSFAPLLLTLFLRRRGWDVVFLGANVPAEWFSLTSETVRPSLIILSAEQLTSAAELLEAADRLNALGVPLAFGGRIFTESPSLQSKVRGYYLGGNLQSAVDVVQQVIQGKAQPSPIEAIPEAFRLARDAFRTHRFAVEAEVRRTSVSSGVPLTYLEIANLNFADSLAAALSLGDFTSLERMVQWVRPLLVRRSLPPDALNNYLRLYRDAVAVVITGDPGQLIGEWLSRLVPK